MESSRRDHLYNVAVQRAILKYNQNTYYPRFSFKLKTGIAFPKPGILFLLRRERKDFTTPDPKDFVFFLNL